MVDVLDLLNVAPNARYSSALQLGAGAHQASTAVTAFQTFTRCGAFLSMVLAVRRHR